MPVVPYIAARNTGISENSPEYRWEILLQFMLLKKCQWSFVPIVLQSAEVESVWRVFSLWVQSLKRKILFYKILGGLRYRVSSGGISYNGISA